MVLKRRAALNGVELDGIPQVLIQGVEPAAGRETINTATVWGGAGSRVTGEHRDSLDVTVKFSLLMKKDRYMERSAVFEQVMAWASGGGCLTLSQKPGRKLQVFAAQLPSEGDPLEWTNRYTITFRACGVPYWQDTVPATASTTAGTAGAVTVGGNTRTVADVTFTNTGSGTIDTVDITVGTSTFQLRSLGLAAGEALVIDHLDDGRRCVLRIRIRSTGGVWRTALDKRTPASADDLWVKPGIVGFGANQASAGTMAVAVYGRYV